MHVLLRLRYYWLDDSVELHMLNSNVKYGYEAQ